MKDVSFDVVYSSDSAVRDGEASYPFEQEKVLLTKAEHIRLKWEANYWKSQHRQAIEREATLKKQVEHLKARVRDLQHRLHGKKSEKSSKADTRDKQKTKRKRGQQQGSAGHGRTDRRDLPVKEEERDWATMRSVAKSAASHSKHFRIRKIPRFLKLK